MVRPRSGVLLEPQQLLAWRTPASEFQAGERDSGQGADEGDGRPGIASVGAPSGRGPARPVPETPGPGERFSSFRGDLNARCQAGRHGFNKHKCDVILSVTCNNLILKKL